MNKFVRLTAVAALMWAGVSYGADTANIRIDQLPQLHQEPQHATVSERVTARFTRSHYRQFALDAEFSGKIFDRYLNMLDYNHNVLLASDVAQFADKRTAFGEELKTGKLTTSYALFNLAQKRRFERYTYALSLLKNRWISPATIRSTSTAAKRRGRKTKPNLTVCGMPRSSTMS